MKKMMTYEAFEEEYMDAVERGTDMLCVWWTDEGDQVNMTWHPYTADLHSDLACEADGTLLTMEEVMDAYEDVLLESAHTAYEEYLERCE